MSWHTRSKVRCNILPTNMRILQHLWTYHTQWCQFNKAITSHNNYRDKYCGISHQSKHASRKISAFTCQDFNTGLQSIRCGDYDNLNVITIPHFLLNSNSPFCVQGLRTILWKEILGKMIPMWKSDKYNKTVSPPISENIPQGSRWLDWQTPPPNSKMYYNACRIINTCKCIEGWNKVYPLSICRKTSPNVQIEIGRQANSGDRSPYWALLA